MVLWLLGGLPLNVVAQTDTVKVEQSDAEWAQALADSLTLLLNDELFTTSQLGLCVYDLTADTALFVHNARQRMRPASTEKILTAITALSELGSDYRFFTRLYVSGEVRGNTLHGDVYVKGGFDPTFGKSDLQQFTTALSSRGIKSVKGALCADVSMKDTLKWGMGWCWDDDNPTLTPLLYLGRDVFMDRMRTMARERGITFSTTKVADCPSDAVLLKTCSTPLSKVLERMMKESDNLYAEAMFYQIAASSGSRKASARQARAIIKRLVQKLGFNPDDYSFADGSGLSLYNYVTAELEVAFLRYAVKTGNILLHLKPSMPIAATDGTLADRMRGTFTNGNVYAKTGTLTGVSTLSGYCTAANGHRLAFAIMNQGLRHTRNGRAFQDKVCAELCRP